MRNRTIHSSNLNKFQYNRTKNAKCYKIIMGLLLFITNNALKLLFYNYFRKHFFFISSYKLIHKQL